ncbi:hypothetical protein N7532_011650 [Penicillium argentinense]|uniref:Uncharacterized protein n=1 Tax=Penicillium argentinense TaxID=1131581 RepID=A0A9W9JVF9_9EURO|nr:uncharacterized protein N7532_011650 [Penicillium argentinense]KAJ5082607.1 hypothetical protein N7532_011650 [Penicillium argentinense]
MPAPVAKGIIVTVSVLVAAGVAVYRSPQFQEWMITSRRKIALALHNLGDGIEPRDPVREDISMTEETGEAAEERRRIARAEIMRRATLLELHCQSKDSGNPLSSFDSLVDKNGNLRVVDDHEAKETDTVGTSTGIDTGAAQALYRGDKTGQAAHLDTSSEVTSNHSSESVVQFTPTTQTPDEVLFDPFTDSPIRAQTPVSFSASSRSEDNDEVYYAHPNPVSNTGHQQDLLGEMPLDYDEHANLFRAPLSSAPSTTGSSGHVEDVDASSDGTLSDLGRYSVGGVATPTGWSEVGSEADSQASICTHDFLI